MKQKEQAQRSGSTLENILFILKSINEYDRGLFGLMAANAVFSALGQFVPVFLPKYVIDVLTGGGGARAITAVVMIAGLTLFVAESINKTSTDAIINRFVLVRLHLVTRSGRKFMTTDFQNLEDPAILDLSKRGDRACLNNQEGVEGIMHRLRSIFNRGCVLVGGGAVITFLHPLVLFYLFLLVLGNFLVSSHVRRQDKKINDALAKVHRRRDYFQRVMTDFSYAKEIRLFGMKEFLAAKYGEEQKESLAGTMKVQAVWLKAKNFFAVTALLEEAMLYAWLCWRVVKGGMGLGDFTMYAAAIRTFSGALKGLFDDLAHIRQQNEIVNDFRRFLTYPERSSGDRKLPADLSGFTCGFVFENVSFRYPGRQEYALQNVNLTIEPGERLAIVGINGAGKSTLVKLLTRLYEPEEGRILLNGVDIRDYDKKEYYRLFSVVFQDAQIFAFSMAENVSMAEYNRTDLARAVSCLEKAGLGPKLAALPQGLDTPLLKVIDEEGVELSGGENQRLVLARALYKDAPVVILDEPTAALDALAEERLYREFDHLVAGKTAVYISHRLASTRFCDRIVMLEGGRVVEMGTHAELMAKGGKYAALFTLQAHYYQEEVSTA